MFSISCSVPFSWTIVQSRFCQWNSIIPNVILVITVFSRLAFFIWSVCFSSIFPLIRTLYILQLILSTILPCYHFCFDPYLLTIKWSFGDKVRNVKLFSWGFALTPNVRCGLIRSILLLMFLPINISAGIRFVTVWGVDL